MFAAYAPPSGKPAAWTAFGRIVRRAFGREINPLCRRVDRSRSRLLIARVVATVLSPAVAVALALTVLHIDQAGARQLAAHRHRLTATTVSAATEDLTRVSVKAQAQAVWDYPPSGSNGGWITVPAGTATGSTVPIWVDDHGNAAAAPPTDTDIAANAAVAGLSTLAVTLLLAEGGYVLRRRTLDRRAVHSWEPDWEQVEPQWSGRKRQHPESGQP